MGPLLAAALLLAPSRAAAFTKEVHTELTREALADPALRLPYDTEAVGMVVAGNLVTDKDEWTSTGAHFDAEDFAAGSKRLRTKIELVVTELDACRADSAREQLGRVLHAVQDFFSHSNWVENNAAGAAVDLFSLKDPPKDLVCDPKTRLGGLTSGYFPDDKRPLPHKCVHAELHKDAPGRAHHAAARARALAESKAVVSTLEAAVMTRFPKRGHFRLLMLKNGSAAFKKANSCAARDGKPESSALAAPPKAVAPAF